MSRKSPTSPGEIRERCRSYAHVARLIDEGLGGDPFHWGLGEAQAYCAKAEDMGLTLVTKNQIARLGYRLRRGVKPVGTRYFGAPISNTGSLYVLECQCVQVLMQEA